MNRKRILLVEDDLSIQALTLAVLRPHFDVVPASTVGEATALTANGDFDLILLDLGLPDEDGLVFARQLRSRSPWPPIIFVTSQNSTVYKIEGLEIGGDDYVTKPFDPDELIARIHAVIRRSINQFRKPEEPARIKLGYVEVDIHSRQVWDAHGEPVNLTRAEFDILMALVNANGRVLSRAVLLDAISTGPEHDAGDRTVDALVSRIRKKLSAEGSTEQIIVTVQGIGYRLGVVRT